MALYGLSSTLLTLLGSNHVHRTASSSDSMSGWQDFRRSSDSVRMTPLGHVHSHDDLARHHHAAYDTTVVPLDSHASSDGGGSDDTSRLAGAVALVLAFAGMAWMTLLSSVPQRWALMPRLQLASRCVTPLERPPNCHEPGRSPWMMEDTGGVRASAGRGRSIV